MKKKIRILFLTWKGMLIDLVIGRYAMKRATIFDKNVVTTLAPFSFFLTNDLISLVECDSITTFQIPNSR